MRIAALVCVLALSGCNLTDQLNTASTTTGTIKAGVNLPSWPDDCKKMEPHYPITDGTEARLIIVGERSALNKANGRVSRCASLYASIRAGFAKK